MELGREDSGTEKDKPTTPSTQIVEETKPSFKIEPITPSSADKKPKCPCRKYITFLCINVLPLNPCKLISNQVFDNYI